jgi:formate/nitrite transporter
MEKMMLSPAEIANATVNAGKAKGSKPTFNLLVLGFLAGMFIAFGAAAATVIWGLSTLPAMGKFLGAAIFPVGIMLVVLAGSELFTGNNLMTLGMFKGEYSFGHVMKNWIPVYIGNFIGSVFMAYLIYASNLWATDGVLTAVGTKAVAIAEGKLALGFSAAMVRGILCNIVVVLAVWISVASKDVTGKIFALWFPITLFVLSGYEHSVANMFFIPVGMFLGGDVTWATMFTNNLIPVTIGNIIGGAIIVPGLYHILFGKNK